VSRSRAKNVSVCNQVDLLHLSLMHSTVFLFAFFSVEGFSANTGHLKMSDSCT